MRSVVLGPQHRVATELTTKALWPVPYPGGEARTCPSRKAFPPAVWSAHEGTEGVLSEGPPRRSLTSQ